MTSALSKFGQYVNANANVVSGILSGNFGNIVSGLEGYMGLFGESNSALKSFLYSKALQQHQYELNRESRRNSFQDTRYSLEQADYNPLLAVGSQAQGGTFGASMNVTDPKTENLQNFLQQASVLSQTKLNSSQSILNSRNAYATVINALNNTNQTNAQVGLINQQAQGQQISNMIQNATGMQTAMATLQSIKAGTANTNAQTALNKAQIKVAKNSAQLIGNQAQQINYQNQSAQAMAQWYQNHPKLAQVAQFNNNVVAPVFGSANTAVNTANSAVQANMARKIVTHKIK